MKRRDRVILVPIVLAVALGVALFAGAGSGSAAPGPGVPRGFFGITPQNELTVQEAEYMKAGGIESIRWPLYWSIVQPIKGGHYNWAPFDQPVEVAARAGLQILPAIASPPPWVTGRGTTMPVDTAAQRAAWKSFLRAAVRRYGPDGQFWKRHAVPGVDYQPAIATPQPIDTWQIWNEANFFYFASPVSVSRYAKLVTISSEAIKSVQPGAKVLLSGLFGSPTASGKRGIPAASFLQQLYRYPGIKKRFDAVSLHPYAVDTEILRELVEEFHRVQVENHDHPALYITEMGWGSQGNAKYDAFEQGPQGQVKQLRASYRYLLANRGRLNLKGVYWFSWKDLQGSCDFCDSVGLFHEGEEFQPKPAWFAFVQLTGGRAWP